jgi:murein DD-endopeptidase MepM/ murein hydrolase activator NlpD
MDLPKNTSYKPQTNLSGAIAPLLQTAKNIGQGISEAKRKARKRVDVSGMQDFVGSLGQYSSGSTGTTGSTPSILGGKATVTTPYMSSTKFEAQHPGIDYTQGINTPVASFTPGVVESVRTGQVKGGPDFGNYVTIRDEQGNLHRFSHLSDSWVKVGQKIDRGTPIGAEGNTGQVYSLSGGSGAHVDYRVRDIYNRYINPNQFVGG